MSLVRIQSPRPSKSGESSICLTLFLFQNLYKGAWISTQFCVSLSPIRNDITMYSLVAAIAFGSLFAILFKLFQRHGVDSLQAIGVNYATALIISLVSNYSLMSTTIEVGAWFVPALFAGLFMMAGLVTNTLLDPLFIFDWGLGMGMAAALSSSCSMENRPI